MKISNRLKTIADLVSFETFADIGTDHGYAPIYLVESGKVKKAIACDLRKEPLKKAYENIKEFGFLDEIETRLGSGFSKLEPDEVESVLIAGMGGMLMIDIIKNDLETVKSLKELILSPHEDVAKVREFVHSIGFSIIDEIMLKDGKQIYNALRLLPSKNLEKYENKVCYEYGKILLERKEPLLKELLERQEKQYLKAVENINKAYENKEIPQNVEFDLKNHKDSLDLIMEAKKWF